MEGLTKVQELAVAQAIYRRIGEVVSTTSATSLRRAVDAELRRDFERDGIKSRNVVIDGVKVGTMAVCETEDTRRRVLRVKDQNAFIDWCEGEDEAVVQYEVVVRTDDPDAAQALYEAAQMFHMEHGCIEHLALTRSVLNERSLLADAAEAGEVPDGCEVAEIGEAPRFKNTVLRVDPDKVGQALGATLPPVVAGLIGGGDE